MKKSCLKLYLPILVFMFLISCKEQARDLSQEKSTKHIIEHFKAYPKAKLFAGSLMRMDSFTSKYIKTRPIDVWLPENYSKSKKYAVLYMHDGQMLFDATATWNGQEWRVDEWASELIKKDEVRDFIVVGIHNIKEERWLDLFPQKAANFLKDVTQIELLSNETANFNEVMSDLNGDNYLRFLVEELKPIIDKEFSVYANQDNTFIMGSSMGGLMSMYGISEYPQVFKGAACLSTHWVGARPIENNPLPEAIFKYMDKNFPEAQEHRVYFDYGTETLDAYYPVYAPRVDSILKRKGYTHDNSKNIMFEGTNHSENSWNERLDIPLKFLLKK